MIFLQASKAQRFYEHQTEQNAKSYRDTARIHAERACAAVARPKAFECVHEQYHAAWERERNQYDLQAQLVTSAWTRAMGLAAIIGMIVGIIGVGLVYATFNETRRTADEAKRSADSFINAERARMMPKARTVLADPNGAQLLLYLRVMNYGNSIGVIEEVAWAPLPDNRYPGEGFVTASRSDDRIVKAEDAVEFTKLNIILGTKYVGGYVRYRTRFNDTNYAYFLIQLMAKEGQAIRVKNRKPSQSQGWPKDT